ncbi:MAG: Na+/H+ antiporter NhaA [Gammaproteobacteria bacterium]|nr:Na+/H+ antiporter NhaA [Gammaproteobacteria bacterium]MAY02260.1 Na+/H+ antiporter NhaA [Gammaproteobacteria bacterium]|tara:strand:- start:45 stop:1250 length:1206 start_codon:yes stop_codon:yes gene_type:complete
MKQTLLTPIKSFFRQEYASGILLFLMAIAAMVAVNSPLNSYYNALLGIFVEVRIGEFEIAKPLLPWINDGLMAIFFFHVGLEIKREMLAGKLSDLSTAVFPVCAAIGGIIMPALIYIMINYDSPTAMEGWAIPTATDIAFTLGVLALLGDRIPSGLKVFLLSLAVMDDLAAILIIAFFYTESPGVNSLLVVAAMLCLLFMFNRMKVTSLVPYVFVGLILWASVLKSGLHATLAGVILALFIPYEKGEGKRNLLVEIEEDLKTSVYFVILPIFAFANSGIYLGGLSFDSLLRPIPLGIIAGLLFGKQLGIFLFAWLSVKIGIARLPKGMNWKHLYGVALLCGIGFTMSLFISSLAFHSGDMNRMVDDRLGIIVGSLLSGILGYLVLLFSTNKGKDDTANGDS